MEIPDTWRPLADVLLGRAQFTTPEVVRASGIELDYARRLWRALGFPPVANDDRVFTRSDIEILRAVSGVVESGSVDPGVLLQLTRVTGQSLARIADAQVTAAAERLDRQCSEQTSGEAPRAELVDRIKALAPHLEHFLTYIWRRHLLAALLQVSATPSAADRVLTIGFADLVGFTAMSQELEPRELAAMVDRFEAIAYEHIPARGGRVVKMIGDEVMFAADDGGVAAEIALALIDAHARDAALPDVRVGIASGPVLAWEGDLLGPTVNLASRLVSLARPKTALVSDEFGAQLQDNPQFALRRLRRARLQGIGRVRRWVLRRARLPAE
jgi:adenylate cyclase